MSAVCKHFSTAACVYALGGINAFFCKLFTLITSRDIDSEANVEEIISFQILIDTVQQYAIAEDSLAQDLVTVIRAVHQGNSSAPAGSVDQEEESLVDYLFAAQTNNTLNLWSPSCRLQV